MSQRAVRCCAVVMNLLTLPCLLAGQVVLSGQAGFGLAEHCIRESGARICPSGTLLGGAVGATIGQRMEVRAEITGGRLNTTASSTLEDHDIAEVQLLAGFKVRPWLNLRAGPVLRGYTDAVARQHWTTVRVGAEARVPLALESLYGVLHGDWIPVASVSGLPKPRTALAAGAGLEWRGRRVTLSMRYTLERFDFPGAAATRRLEELSSLQLRAGMRWFRL